MKRLIAFAVMILTAVVMVACSSPIKSETSRKNGLNCAFESSVNITIDKLNAEGILKRFGDGMWDVEFSAPNTLSGVKLVFDSGNVSASYKGLDFSVPQSALPVKAMMLNLIEAVDANARLEELKGSENDNVLEVSGSLEGGDYIISVGKDGRIVSFEMENNKLKIVFTDMKEISSEQSQTTETIPTETLPETTSETENPEDVIDIPEQNAEEVIEVPESEETADLITENAEETVEVIEEDAQQTLEITEEY
ncbi:MAG: hypothetical protein NC177_11925 [Ruminococcus flavefaciens]|nr:hypothetical protein [Ruminococcus flavefaciens]